MGRWTRPASGRKLSNHRNGSCNARFLTARSRSDGEKYEAMWSNKTREAVVQVSLVRDSSD